jgi:hypothetical protein
MDAEIVKVKFQVTTRAGCSTVRFLILVAIVSLLKFLENGGIYQLNLLLKGESD